MIDDISIRYSENFTPGSLRSPVLIEGLPGIGQVGKLVAEYMIHMIGAEKIGEIHSIYFPPHVIIEENGVARLIRNELYLHRGESRDIIFLTGDYQSASNEGHYLLTDAYLDIAVELKVVRIYTVGGFGVGHLVEEPRVFGAVNNLAIRDEIEAAGVVIQREEPGGGIVGAAGLMLGLGAQRGQDAVCLMGETSGYIVDPRSAAVVLSVLSSLLAISVDSTQLNDRAVEMEKAIEGLIENERTQKEEELNYIG
ncbi:MAG TPA: proteasome assembly chaperone family protein [Methanoregulaceae archaeon]|nr:proteasome assembly chaperone family protein [Methanoregulaceae archaeon]HPD74537.1 proteasome assembly chaperone family protein [Methanoregulaceae archaeon]HRY76130.1 proteasome assembly chaperone family protein [Methanoregulaceae archaeon]